MCLDLGHGHQVVVEVTVDLILEMRPVPAHVIHAFFADSLVVLLGVEELLGYAAEEAAGIAGSVLPVVVFLL